jgi:hypothetical protein
MKCGSLYDMKVYFEPALTLRVVGRLASEGQRNEARKPTAMTTAKNEKSTTARAMA